MKNEVFFGDSILSVEMTEAQARRVRLSLEFSPQKKFYLRLPTREHLPFVMFCLTATNRLTVSIAKIFEKFDKEIQHHLQTSYLSKNDQMTNFNAPV
jgi:hypothetical protein